MTSRSTCSVRAPYPRGLSALTDIAEAALRIAVARAPQLAQLTALALGVALTAYVVRRRPEGAPSIRANLGQDVMHVLSRALVLAPLTAWWLGMLGHASGPGLALLAPLPTLAGLVAYVVLVDLFEYGVHRLFHRVPALWRLHEIHHSQTWVSPLTTTRIHPIELLAKRGLSWLFVLVIGEARPAWVLWIVVDGFWGFFVHSGLPVSLGPLRYLVVSPRFHALHHAREARYHDANFGERLAIWDVLFGTARFDDATGVAQGVDDASFPVERDGSVRGVLATFVAQLAHPFRRSGSGTGGPRGPWGKRALLVVLGIAVALVLAEVALRIAGVSSPAFYDYDDELGWAPTPLADGAQTSEGHAHVHIDAAGFRDRDHALVAAPGTLRIAVLGDSYTDAIQVELEDTWWRRLEGELGDCAALAGRPVEVMSFGVRGYGTAQELLLYRRRVRAYHPDVVVLLYTPENDLVENSRALSAKSYLAPFFVLRGDALELHPPTDGATFLGLPRTWLLRAAFGLRRHSRLIAALDLEGLWHALRDAERERARFVADDDPELARLVTYAQPYASPGDPVIDDARRVTDRLLETLGAEVQAEGSTFFLVTGSSPIQVYPDAARREGFARRIGVEDLYASEHHLDALAERHGWPHLLLAPELAREADASGAFLHGFAATGLGIGHWNEAGHASVARHVATALCAERGTP